jgi:uncharacterized peroxidase-related enzyme
VTHHGAGLRTLIGSFDLSRSLVRHGADADGLSEGDAEMIRYALRLTRAPSAIEETHIHRLRSVGFDDRAILDICQVTAYYNYVNRLADGLGVELEAFWKERELTLTREEFMSLRSCGDDGLPARDDGAP